MNIHERIKKYQNARGWTLHYMALEADLSTNTVSGWFKKNATPTIDAIEKLCNAFGITLSEFFNEHDKQPKHLSEVQQEHLDEFDLLDQREKDDVNRLIKTINEKTRKLTQKISQN